MPLRRGKKNIGRNIKELETGPVGKTRAKGIATLARRLGISLKAAQEKQAKAIALSYAKKRKKR